MPRYRVDPVSLAFGLVFIAAGLIVLLGGSLFDEGRFLVPAALIGLGAALFASTGPRDRPRTAIAGSAESRGLATAPTENADMATIATEDADDTDATTTGTLDGADATTTGTLDGAGSTEAATPSGSSDDPEAHPDLDEWLADGSAGEGDDPVSGVAGEDGPGHEIGAEGSEDR